MVLAEFVVAGQRLRCSDSPPVHQWDFTPAVSLWVDCGSGDEQKRLLGALATGGREFMPLDDYGFGPLRLGRGPLRRVLAARCAGGLNA
ncbi:VOC family protein, partial [Pseudonocardia sp. ICBG601]|uniref:VOC family protein n=1 Tax=Pseudonocardia sp. ICBG601 TaxID=2846759 RepID=UPI0027E2D7CA